MDSLCRAGRDLNYALQHDNRYCTRIDLHVETCTDGPSIAGSGIHDKRALSVTRNFEQRFAALEPDEPVVRPQLDTDASAGIERDPRTIGERDYALLAGAGPVRAWWCGIGRTMLGRLLPWWLAAVLFVAFESGAMLLFAQDSAFSTLGPTVLELSNTPGEYRLANSAALAVVAVLAVARMCGVNATWTGPSATARLH